MGEQIKPIPAATAEDVGAGWKLNVKFISQIAYNADYVFALEVVEDIILQLAEGGYLTIQHPELLKEGEGS